MASKKKADESTTPRAKAPRKKPAAAKTSTKPSTGRKGAKSDNVAVAPDRPAATYAGRVVVERQIGGRTLTLETGRMAKLSDGACVARYGDTMVLAAVNSSKAPDGIDFFPLTVDYREKTSAAGVIPGGFFKREGRPSTKEILACRIIDRSIRPMFPDGFKRDVQVLSQVLSTDRENDPDVVASIASFAALALSSLPHGQTLGMVRIGMVGDDLQVNPLWSTIQSAENRLNLTVAGHADAIVMVEAGAKEVSEEHMLSALELAHKVVREIVAMIEELAAKAGKPKMAYTPPAEDAALVAAIEHEFGKQLRAAPLTVGTKQTRSAAVKAAKELATAKFHAPTGASEADAKVWNTKVAGILGGIVKDAERQSVLRGTRADGRDSKSIRPITIEVGVLPRVHGSALFTRGETQALGVVTLGGTDDQQIIDGLMPEPRKRFLLHYSFPPFSVGETKRMLAPGRREIGHGALAERGLESILPTREEFPYTIRITSEILESNGSSSMATVCAGTLSMMDAGVAIKQPVAGIAMGLVMEGKRYAILSDILGSEDACGDMDFKVVGTGRGITALQMDIKCDGLTRAILSEALEQARVGRLHILREMLKALRSPREQLSPNAPRLESVKVPNEKIGLIIGPGGKNIRQLQETFECKISIEDSGLCTITGINAEKVKACVEHIRSMTAEIELGALYEGRITAIKEFGAFVEILPGQEGLVHVSELSDGFIRAVTDVARIGDVIKVKVIAIDDFGKVKLSRKAVLLAERGGAPAAAEAGAAEPRPSDRADRHERPERPDRPERPERFDRPERGDRRGERFDRPERPDRGERFDRPERAERPGFDRPDRPAARDRDMDRGPRPEWREREGARFERGGRPDRPDRDAGERGPRGGREERPERGGREFAERGFRAGREDRPERADRDAGERPYRGREDRERGGRFEGRDRDDAGRPAPRFDRAPADAADRPARPERPHHEPHREVPPAGERHVREPRPERGPHDRGREDRDRGPRRDREDSHVPRERVPGDAADRGERRPRRDHDAAGHREERGRSRGPRPAGMPMAEFGDGDEEPMRPARPPHRPDRGDRPAEPVSERPRSARPPQDVGQLESIDSVLGDDEPTPRRRGRRPPRG